MARPRTTDRIESTATTGELEQVRHLAFREARRRFVSPDSAEDIAQVAATRYLARRTFIREIPAWVRTVVQHLVYRRNAARMRRQLFETLAEEPQVGPDASFERHQLLEAILGRLPERDRTFLELGLAGRPHAEIARTLGVPANAVGANLARVVERAGRVRKALRSTSTEKTSSRR
jgi:RNA polymerase sigma factor (sigma-70 family)